MQLHPIKSSNIESIGHNAQTKVLRIKFSRGKTFDYSNVPDQEVLHLRTAVSVGSYFSKQIRTKFSGVEVK
jgi:hypothetical protein